MNIVMIEQNKTTGKKTRLSSFVMREGDEMILRDEDGEGEVKVILFCRNADTLEITVNTEITSEAQP